MKISEIKGERAMEVMADLIEPVSAILADDDVKQAASSNTASALKVALKKHSKECSMIVALLEGENPETYEPTLATLPMKLMEIVNDPEVSSLFMSLGQNETEDSSGSVMENTQETKK